MTCLRVGVLGHSDRATSSLYVRIPALLLVGRLTRSHPRPLGCLLFCLVVQIVLARSPRAVHACVTVATWGVVDRVLGTSVLAQGTGAVDPLH